ncbi:MAG: DUF1501 domain-containing protein [Planctomycetia bacterium]|nr:DUF1501 domain-containing protein [Planctomycetia bacterium]
MALEIQTAAHTLHSQHAFQNYYGSDREGLAVVDRRGMLKAGLAGIAGLSLPELLRARAGANETGRKAQGAKSVILVWMSGGPSHIDTWDMKPDRRLENRGPFAPIATKLPGVQICEHLPKQAAMLDKFTLIRSVNAQSSNHNPNRVFQTGNLESQTVDAKHPAIGSVIAKLRGPNHPAMPPYVAAVSSPRKHLAFAGYLGKRYDPFIAENAAKLPILTIDGVDTGTMTGSNSLFQLPEGLSVKRLGERLDLLRYFDRVRMGLDQDGALQALGAYQSQAVEMVTGKQAQAAFDLSLEPAASRERYGKHLWGQQALLARRLVEAGVSFVTIGMNHSGGASWDHHGDNIPPYGGIQSGLKPMLPIFDHALSTLVADLDERGLLDDVLVIAMGEFGREPIIGRQGIDGRNHWPAVMSMALAGGGLRHGQVIGASDVDGGAIKDRAVTPGDLAATIYRYMDVPLDATYLDNSGRPHPIVQNNGRPIHELF